MLEEKGWVTEPSIGCLGGVHTRRLKTSAVHGGRVIAWRVSVLPAAVRIASVVPEGACANVTGTGNVAAQAKSGQTLGWQPLSFKQKLAPKREPILRRMHGRPGLVNGVSTTEADKAFSVGGSNIIGHLESTGGSLSTSHPWMFHVVDAFHRRNNRTVHDALELIAY